MSRGSVQSGKVGGEIPRLGIAHRHDKGVCSGQNLWPQGGEPRGQQIQGVLDIRVAKIKAAVAYMLQGPVQGTDKAFQGADLLRAAPQDNGIGLGVRLHKVGCRQIRGQEGGDRLSRKVFQGQGDGGFEFFQDVPPLDLEDIIDAAGNLVIPVGLFQYQAQQLAELFFLETELLQNRVSPHQQAVLLSFCSEEVLQKVPKTHPHQIKAVQPLVIAGKELTAAGGGVS